MTASQSLAPRSNSARAHRRRGALVLCVLILLLAFLLVQTAWMSDDAYITLRTVDNLLYGHGLTWNVQERVQAFTHPLWMLLLSGATFVTGDVYYTTLFLSIALTVAAAVLLAFGIARSQIAAALVLVSLLLSKSFIDFSTSGLENALSHLLVVLFFLIYLRVFVDPYRLFLLCLVAACSAVNRLDSALILLPALVLNLIDQRAWLKANKLKAVGITLLGFTPLLFWESFSLLYYGFLVPNTFYAKLTTGIPEGDLLVSGISYFVQSARLDPLLPLTICAALIVALWDRSKLVLAIALGILLYLLYILRIGGDFMSGRFFTAPYLCALIILSATRLTDQHRKLYVVWGLILAVGLIWPYSPLRGTSGLQCDIASPTPTDVSDERGCYFKDTGLVNQRKDAPTLPDHGWAIDGLRARSEPSNISIMGGVGMFGFFAGPGEYVVDLNALANPLLARIPVPLGKKWRIGHFERLIPGGYLQTLAEAQNRLCDPNLARYYDKLSLITRGRLLDPQRLKAIWQINTGQLDHLLAAYDAVATTDQALLCNAQAVVDVPFEGGPRLRGYAIPTNQAAPGDQLMVTLYWQGESDGATPLHSFVHIRNGQPNGPMNPRSDSEIWAQDEHVEPGGRLTTDYWPPQVYSDQFVLVLPEDMPPGDYFVEIGWFNPESGEQLDPLDEAMDPPLRELWRSVLLPSITIR